MKPEVWMISISNNSISTYYKEISLPTWTKHGFKVNHFEAKTPKDLSVDCNFLDFGMKNKVNGDQVEFTDTERSIWYSNYFLWKECLEKDSPILIVEHDVCLSHEINSGVYSNDMVCLCHYKEEGRRIRLAGGSYYIKPFAAKKLLEITDKQIVRNSDHWIEKICEKVGKFSNLTSYHLNDADIGTTIVHN